MKHVFVEDDFDYPVYVDLNDDFGRLSMFQKHFSHKDGTK